MQRIAHEFRLDINQQSKDGRLRPLSFETLRRLIMKKQSLVLFSISSLFVILGVAALHAQTFDHEIRANVPFRFMVGNQTLPAGAYRVTRIDDQGVLLIKS